MKRINMLSSADKVKGQGVGSAYEEQVSLVKNNLAYEVVINDSIKEDIVHHHTIDLKHYIFSKWFKKSIHLGYVHFLPETLKGSIKLPRLVQKIFERYVIEFYKSMDYLVTVNPYFIDLLEQYNIPKEKVYYIPNFVSEQEFYPVKVNKKLEIRKEYNIPSKSFVVLGVGQVQTRKGVLDFIEVAKENPDISFVWAGGFSFGAITDGYKTLKETTENPPKNVTFTGIIDRSKMNELYNMSDMLFMPSYNELFPMSILEAMSVGKPILLRDLDIYKGILEGYYCYGDKNKDFSDIILKLSKDNLYYQQQKNAAISGSHFYSRTHVLKQWENLYDLLDRKMDTKYA